MIYIEHFYARSEADALLEFIKTLPSVRPKNKRNDKSFLRRLSFPGYSPSPDDCRTAARYHICGHVLNAPQLYQELSSRLTAFAGKDVNYLSTIGYLTDDHMNFHQHAEDMKREDQTVYVLSLGAVHPIAIRYGATVGKKFVPNGRQEIFYPAHGSLYVLPSAFNTPGSGLEAQHAVLEGNDYSHNGLRISINAKHIPPGLSREDMKKACSRPAGRSNSQSASLEIHPHRAKKTCLYPADVALPTQPCSQCGKVKAKDCPIEIALAQLRLDSRPRCRVPDCGAAVVPDWIVECGGDGTLCYNHGGNVWGPGSGKPWPPRKINKHLMQAQVGDVLAAAAESTRDAGADEGQTLGGEHRQG